MITMIRMIPAMLGNGRKQILPSEMVTRRKYVLDK
jgi:hypothetical protein